MEYIIDPIEEADRIAWVKYWERRRTKPRPFGRHIKLIPEFVRYNEKLFNAYIRRIDQMAKKITING